MPFQLGLRELFLFGAELFARAHLGEWGLRAMLAGVLFAALHMLVKRVTACAFGGGRRQGSSLSHVGCSLVGLDAAAIIAQEDSAREFLLRRAL